MREFIKAGVCRGAHIKRVIESFYEAKNGKSKEGVGEADNGEGEELHGSGMGEEEKREFSGTIYQAEHLTPFAAHCCQRKSAYKTPLGGVARGK